MRERNTTRVVRITCAIRSARRLRTARTLRITRVTGTARAIRTAAVAATIAAVVITSLALTADYATAGRGRGGYGRPVGYASRTVRTVSVRTSGIAVRTAPVTAPGVSSWPRPWCDGSGPIRQRLASGLPGLTIGLGAGPRAILGVGPYCPTGTGPLMLQLSRPGRGMQGPAGAMRRGEGAPRRGERALRAVENLRVRWLMQELRPGQEQRAFIREAYEQGLDRRYELLQERAVMLTRMREMVRPGSPAGSTPGAEVSEQEMRELAARYRQVERDLAQSAWDTEDRIFERLSPAQKLRYIILNERFDTELRERIGALRQRGLRPGAPIPPDDVPDDLPE